MLDKNFHQLLCMYKPISPQYPNNLEINQIIQQLKEHLQQEKNNITNAIRTNEENISHIDSLIRKIKQQESNNRTTKLE